MESLLNALKAELQLLEDRGLKGSPEWWEVGEHIDAIENDL